MSEKNLLLTRIAEFCEQRGFQLNSHLTGLTVSFEAQSVTVDVKPVSLISTPNNDLLWEVTISSIVSRPSPGMLTLESVGLWNRYATILSTVLIDNQLILFSKFTIYRDSVDVTEFVYSRLACAAIWLSFGLSTFMSDGEPNSHQFIHGSPLENPSNWLGLSSDDRKHSSLISAKMLDEATDLALQRGLVAFSDSNRFSVEFPWDPDSLSVLFSLGSDEDKKTSLIQIEKDIESPLYGKGVLLTIQFRLSFLDDDLHSFVNELNVWEFRAVNLPPFFGSWCADTKLTSPTFVTFIPSVFSDIATPVSLLSWAWGRHEAIRALMQAGKAN